MKKYVLSICFIACSLIISAQEALKDQYNIMPWPQQIVANSGYFTIDNDLTIYIKGGKKSDRIKTMTTQFLRNLSDKTGVFLDHGFALENNTDNKANVIIEYKESPDLKLGLDESYTLTIDKDNIFIKSQTDIGGLYALQTLLQLVTVKDGQFVFPSLEIKDQPRFAWRGLMLDCSRHFMPMEVIKRNLDLMTYVKLNVFHWHLSDDQGFRFESKRFPELTAKGSDGLFYSQEQMKEIIEYADKRGIRVMPEIDVPGHASAILTAFPEFGSRKRDYTIERNAGVFNPTLDPTNENTYTFLAALFEEVSEVFPDEYFHIGGDENAGKDWDENEDIQKFMKHHQLKTNHDLQTYMNIKLQKVLEQLGKKVMGWDEIMTPNMPKTAIIHSWRGENEGLKKGETLVQAAKNGYKTVLSNGFYIDLMQPAEDHYLTKFIVDDSLTENDLEFVLGGEATMWSELVTPLTVDSRIWPRTAAIAERFWSNKDVRDVDNMYHRLNSISFQLENIGSTHLRNRDVILRNIAQNQSIEALKQLVRVSEPFKIYKRNAGGFEYEMYSPFTLFADACTADAQDARLFNTLVANYIKSPNKKNKDQLVTMLSQWNDMCETIKAQSEMAPNLKKIMPYVSRVNEVTTLTIKVLGKEGITKSEYNQIITNLETQDNPLLNIDVEFAANKGIKDLVDYLSSKTK